MGIFFKTYGILGQNARNLEYIKGYNDALARKLADSKLKTKDFLSKKGVNVPKTLMIIKKHKDLDILNFDTLVPPFVIKPNNGFGGKGIIVVDSKDSAGNYVSNTEEVFSQKQFLRHFSDIIDGFYSLSGTRDKVLIEKKVVLDRDIDLLGKFGLPDIRILVFNMVPIMAMLRVPTKESGGKANLHAGACGVGIDIGTGKLTYITRKGRIVKSIPDIGDIRGIKIPKWKDILTLAVQVQHVTRVGYLGCDIVLDQEDGPLLLEMNIRAGLEVQIANMAPMKDRLEKVEGVNINSVEKGVRLGRDLFGGDIEEKIKNITGKKVLGDREYLTIKYNDKDYKYLAEIKTSGSNSYLDKEFAKNVLKCSEKELKSGIIRLKGEILGEEKNYKFIIKDLGGVNIILGLNVLKGFLIDPFKYRKGELPISGGEEYKHEKNIAINKRHKEQLLKIDKEIVSLDKKLIILKHIAPVNIAEEKQQFIESEGAYIPELQYAPLKPDLKEIRDKLEKIDIPDIPLANIYKRKKEEIKAKISFLESFNSEDCKMIEHFSKILFGSVNEENLEEAKKVIAEKEVIVKEEEYLVYNEIEDMIKKFNHIYGINIRLRSGQRSARFVMKGDELLMREGALVGKKELRSIIAHEIEGHYLRKLNGKKIEYKLFSHGTAGYLEYDEGIAVFNQNRFLGPMDKKYFGVYERYYFTYYAMKHSYKKLLSHMLEYYDNDYERVFNYILRLKRSFPSFKSEGVFVRDFVYLNGYKKVEEYIHSGGELKDLYLGKVGVKDLEELKDSYFIKLNYSDITVPFFL